MSVHASFIICLKGCAEEEEREELINLDKPPCRVYRIRVIETLAGSLEECILPSTDRHTLSDHINYIGRETYACRGAGRCLANGARRVLVGGYLRLSSIPQYYEILHYYSSECVL